jgi:IS1 family transposase
MIEQTTQNHENRPKGYEIEPVHNPVPRKIDWTRRKDAVFLELLAPFGITRYYTDGWGAYETAYRPRAARSRQRAYAEN